MTSRLMKTLGQNAEILPSILEGLLAEFSCPYEVLTGDSGEYFFQSKAREGSQSFCQMVRTVPGGEVLCKACCQKHAQQAVNSGKSITYVCDLGLFEMAVPIVADGTLLATIFWGQGRSTDPQVEEEGKNLANKAAGNLGLSAHTLLALRERTPLITAEWIEPARFRLWNIATFLSNLVRERTEWDRERKDLTYTSEEMARIVQALAVLDEWIESTEEFWRKMPTVMDELCKVIGAVAAAALMSERVLGTREARPVLKAVSGLPIDFIGRTYIENTSEIRRALISMKPKVVPFGAEIRPGTLCHDVKHLADIGDCIDTVAIVPVRLDPGYVGLVVFFMSTYSDVSKSLPIGKEISMLRSVADRITTTYQHCALYSLRGEWLTTMGHQLLAPLTGVQGHSENLVRWLSPWAQRVEKLMQERGQDIAVADETIRLETTIKRLTSILNTADCILWMTTDASRLARNFSWIAELDRFGGRLRQHQVRDMVGLLISYAKKVQGLAKVRHIRRVHVDKESVSLLDGKLYVDRLLFSQAVGNLLDNAVKYSDIGTDVLLTAELTNGWGIIKITNRGIPVYSDEVDKIFDPHVRTDAAKTRAVIGTGIGLTIARKIVELHDGTLTVKPSEPIHEPDYSGYETTFSIRVPLGTPKGR